MNVRDFNRKAWDREVERGIKWTVPVDSAAIAAAREGVWEVVLTPSKPVPRAWFPELKGIDVLCLASGGGQQGPILAAAGANVTVLDASPKQLGQDRLVAERDGLEIETVEGDMADLSMFHADTFDLVFHPCSNCFAQNIFPVWREAFRVLRQGGVLLAGFCNPVMFLFDEESEERGELKVRHKLPYSPFTSLTEAERAKLIESEQPLSFSHSLDAQIGGQLDAGFVITGFYEDYFPGTELGKYMPSILATKAQKPA